MSKSLSILLPTYNCDCTALISELQRQCVAEEINFEIIVADDASPDKRFIIKNRTISNLDGVCLLMETFRSKMLNLYTTI